MREMSSKEQPCGDAKIGDHCVKVVPKYRKHPCVHKNNGTQRMKDAACLVPTMILSATIDAQFWGKMCLVHGRVRCAVRVLGLTGTRGFSEKCRELIKAARQTSKPILSVLYTSWGSSIEECRSEVLVFSQCR